MWIAPTIQGFVQPNAQANTVPVIGRVGIPIPDGLYAGAGVTTQAVALQPSAVYDGGYPDAKVGLRIANGGAGQSGLIGEWANAFIKYYYEQNKKHIKVEWYLGDTTESLGLIAAESVDIAVTYNEAAELQSEASGASKDRKYGFRDHFLLVGPKEDPAQLKSETDVLVMFNKIVTFGNKDIASPPNDRLAVRFLSRFDKSATNIKESQLFIIIGQVPWALVYSKWYHQYPRFPIQALEAAAALTEYTITDLGTWLSSSSNVTDKLDIYKEGLDSADDLLLNPAHVLSAAHPLDQDVCDSFMSWVVSDGGGQRVIGEFKKHGRVLYSKAPKE